MPTDAERYQWLKENCVRIVPASRDGPEYPQLILSWDVMEWYKHQRQPKEDLDKVIDKAMDPSQKKSFYRSYTS